MNILDVFAVLKMGDKEIPGTGLGIVIEFL
jgi:hypothetical protein